MKTTIIHKGKERTWEGPLKNWEAHKEYIMGWCDGREVLIDGDEYDYIAFNCGKDIYSFKPEKAEPVVCNVDNQAGFTYALDSNKRYKITIEEV